MSHERCVKLFFAVDIFDPCAGEMARNKRKKIKDKDKLKSIGKEARKRWRNKKAREKALKNTIALKLASPVNNRKANEEKAKQACEREEEKSAEPKHRSKTSSVKEINPVEIVRIEKSVGCGTFGVCYLAYYQNITVAVKEYRMKSKSVDEI